MRSSTFALGCFVFVTLPSCGGEDASAFAVITRVRQIEGGDVVFAGYSACGSCGSERGFLEIVESGGSKQRLVERLRGGEAPEDSSLPPILGLTECASGELVATGGILFPPVVVTGPPWSSKEIDEFEDVWVAVAGTSCEDLIAVGWSAAADSAEAAGAAVRFDGEAWTHEELPEATPRLRGIWAEESRAFAAGDSGTLLEYDGSAWTAAESPTDVDLHAVWGIDGHVFAAGGEERGTYVILELSGDGWQIVATGPGTLLGLHGTAPDDVYAVGGVRFVNGSVGGTVIHYDGSSFKSVPSGAHQFLWDVFATADGPIVSVGPDSTIVEFVR